MNYLKKQIAKRQRKQLALHAHFTIAEAPAVYRWINGDDEAEEELKKSYRKRALGLVDPT